MQVHHIYCGGDGSGRTPRENWQRCDYFSRQSSRTCADFYPAVLRASGKTEEEVLSGGWPPPEDVMENLSVTEHLRWCAFQYVMGYAPMPPEVWRERAERYRREAAGGGEPAFRIGKDEKKRLQACLIPWEKLDDLSRRENEITGGCVDYKQMDRSNVLMLSRVLAARRK